jgi:hypothetical protein
MGADRNNTDGAIYSVDFSEMGHPLRPRTGIKKPDIRDFP